MMFWNGNGESCRAERKTQNKTKKKRAVPKLKLNDHYLFPKVSWGILFFGLGLDAGRLMFVEGLLLTLVPPDFLVASSSESNTASSSSSSSSSLGPKTGLWEASGQASSSSSSSSPFDFLLLRFFWGTSLPFLLDLLSRFPSFVSFFSFVVLFPESSEESATLGGRASALEP